MKKTLAMILVLVVFLGAIAQPVSAEVGDTTQDVAMVNRDTGDMIAVYVIDAGTPEVATATFGLVDDAFIEQQVTGSTVLKSETVTPIKGSTGTRMFLVSVPGISQPVILVVASAKSSLFMFLLAGTSIDSDVYVKWIATVIHDGKVKSPPAGFEFTTTTEF